MNRNGWSDAQLMASMAEAAGCLREEYWKTQEALSAAGFNCLGSGAFGSAYTRPDMKGYCIKLSGGNQDTYPAYVYWAMANPMPCIPEFRHPVFSQDREQFMVMLPRYADCKSELLESQDYATAMEIIYGYDQHNLMEPKTPLQLAARKLRDFFGGEVSWDFHRGNLMWDSLTQQYVITDPMCGGDVEALVTKVTGKGTERHVITEQIDFGFGDVSGGKVWPRPEFADRVVPVEIGAGLDEHAALERQRRLDEMRMPVQQFNFPALEGLAAELQRPFMLKARVPDAIGQAAQWVRDQGITPQQAERIGHLAQEWPDKRIQQAGGNFVEFAMFPSIPPIFNLGAIPEQAVAIKHFRVPVDILRTLRDNWKVQAVNKHMQHWRMPQLQNLPKFLDPR